MSNSQPKIVTGAARYGVRLNSVIFPLDFIDLRLALAKNGYELASVGEMPTTSRIRYGGVIARKGEENITVESDSSEIGVLGKSLLALFTSFEELAKIVTNELEVNLHDNVRFYWALANCKISTAKVPRQELAKLVNKTYSDKFSQIVGENLASYSARFGIKDVSPNRDDWLEIAVEPDIIKEHLYNVGMVFRKPSRSDTETFVKNFETNLVNLIRAIEA